MAITIREDESETGGFALIDLGQVIEADPIRLAFRRQDAEPRDLGPEGWQAEPAWHDAQRLDAGASTTAVRVGPAVVDWIDELVPVEIAVEGIGPLGMVAWPQLTRSPLRLNATRIKTGTPQVGRAPAAQSQRPAAATLTAALAPKPAAAAPAARRYLPVAGGALVALVALLILAAPLVALHFSYYGLVVEAHEPLDFVESTTGNAPSFTPASATVTVRRARWARWFEGWWVRYPPPVEPVIADAWLGATPGAASTTSISFTLAPQPKAFPASASRLETTVAFRSKFSGTSTDAQPATLQRAPGKLIVDQPAPVTIKGLQGGPFTPPQVTYKLAAQGLGFRWQSDAAPPTWLELAPAQGELRENASVSAVVKLRPAVQSLGPGTYESKLHFKNASSSEVVERLVRIVVEPRAQLPPGKLALDAPPELKFTGAQGGPFAPQSIPLKLKATGAGFKWTAEGAPPWLELAPAQGELRDNGSMDVTARMRPTAQTLTPATYEGRITFKKTGPDQSVVEPVRLVVSISFR